MGISMIFSCISLTVFGYVLALGGSALGIAGAIGTSSKALWLRHLGFLLWIVNSPMLVVSMIGVALGWFEPVSVIILAPLNSVYWITAIRGFRNTRQEECW
jgi:hypothetical protein